MKTFDWKKRKSEHKKITMLTCYDYTLARVLSETNIDTLLIGDSSSMVIFGEENTVGSKIKNLTLLTKAVKRGAPQKFIISDLPFGFMQIDQKSFVKGLQGLVSAGANAVKIESLKGNENRISEIINMGVPVIGHLGLTPQHIQNFGGFKVQGKSDQSRKDIYKDAIELEKLGVLALVLECIPEDLAESITKELSIPTIGIGAGSSTDGQVLVLHDMLGLTDLKSKFIRRYIDGSSLIRSAVNNFVNDVENKNFPHKDESYA